MSTLAIAGHYYGSSVSNTASRNEVTPVRSSESSDIRQFTVWIQSIPEPTLVLTQPIQIDIEVSSEGMVMASNSTMCVFGIGDTIPSAIVDFAGMLAELLQELEEDESVLSSHLTRQLGKIRTLVARQ